jgi:hypothetical protein
MTSAGVRPPQSSGMSVASGFVDLPAVIVRYGTPSAVSRSIERIAARGTS